MKRLALVLAAAVLGTGCFVADDDGVCPRTVSIDWTGNAFRTADGLLTGCGGAGVQDVDVWMDGLYVGAFSCAGGGVTVTDVQRGVYVFTVEGIALDGRIVNRDQFEVDARACGDRFVQAEPGEGYANLLYEAPGGCSGAACYLWFQVFDEVAGTVAAAVTKDSPLSDQVFYAYPADVVFPLPAGTYTLDWMELVASPDFDVAGSMCTPVAFTVTSGQTSSPPVPLAAGGPACH